LFFLNVQLRDELRKETVQLASELFVFLLSACNAFLLDCLNYEKDINNLLVTTVSKSNMVGSSELTGENLEKEQRILELRNQV
jgi:hypothetical protein